MQVLEKPQEKKYVNHAETLNKIINATRREIRRRLKKAKRIKNKKLRRKYIIRLDRLDTRLRRLILYIASKYYDYTPHEYELEYIWQRLIGL